MLPLTAGERELMEGTQEAAMMDTCLIAEPSTTEDAYNNPVAAWTWSSATESECGFNPSPSREVMRQVPECDAVLRLPVDTTISAVARVRITKRFGETQSSPRNYEVIGNPRRGASGLLVWLRKVTDGS